MTPGAFAGRMRTGVSMVGSREHAVSPLWKDTTNCSPITLPRISAYALAQKAFMQVWGPASKFPACVEVPTPESVDYDCPTSGASDQETQDVGGRADTHFGPPAPAALPAPWFRPARAYGRKQAAAAAAAAEGGTMGWHYPSHDPAKKQAAARGCGWLSSRAEYGVVQSHHPAGSFAADADGEMHKVAAEGDEETIDHQRHPHAGVQWLREQVPSTAGRTGVDQVSPPAPVCRAPPGLTAVAGPTTLILRNIPARCTIDEVLEVIHDSGFQGAFEFLYVPIKPGTRMNKGYGFVAFADFDCAMQFSHAIDGKSFGSRTSSKEISVDLAKAHISLAQMPTTVAKTSRWGPVLAMQ